MRGQAVIVSRKGATGKKVDKKKQGGKKKATSSAGGASGSGPLIVQEGEIADKVLFITNLPEEAND